MQNYFEPWFVGLVDGEGCFCLSVRKRLSKITNQPYVAKDISFQIALRQDDQWVLKDIAGRLGVGVIRHYDYRNKKTSKGFYTSNPMTQFAIRSVKDLKNVIIPLFDKYPLLTKKSKDYLIWREAVLFCYKKGKKANNQYVKRYSEEDYKYLLSLREKLKGVKKYVEN